MIDLVKVAIIGSTQGKSGALKFYPEEHLEETIRGIDFVFIIINGSKVPFKVKKINDSNNPWLIHIDQMDNPEKAQPFTNAEVYVESEKVGDIEVVTDDTLKDYKVLSEEGDPFGEVLEVEEHPKQVLLVVQYNNNVFRIPFHPDLIEELDNDNKSVRYSYTTEDLSMLFA